METVKEREGRKRTAPGVGFSMSLVIFAGESLMLIGFQFSSCTG